MTDQNDFNRQVKDTLAKRAGQRCSNLACGKPTTGPHSDDERAVNIGEAAHIRGARRGSARHDSTMTPEERRVITNGIWLCRGCAALIDRDEQRYSVDVIYEWKRSHERQQVALIGGPSFVAGERERLLVLFRGESPAALQLALDRPEYWAELSSVELMRDKLRPVRKALAELRDGLVHVPRKVVTVDELAIWTKETLNDLLSLMGVLGKIVSEAIVKSWDSGTPDEILHAANLLSRACGHLVQWEQRVAGALFPDGFDDLRLSMCGWTAGLLEEMDKTPSEISRLLQMGAPGNHQIVITFAPPDNMQALAGC